MTSDGYNDWRNLSKLLKEHEGSHDHIVCLTSWTEFELRLHSNQTIDKHVQEKIKKEKNHWREVLTRIFALVKTLAKNNLAFRGDNGKIGQRQQWKLFEFY